MDISTANVIEIRTISCRQTDNGQIIFGKRFESVYPPSNDSKTSVENKSNGRTAFISTEPLSMDSITHHTSTSEMVKFVTQHHSYSATNESAGGIDLRRLHNDNTDGTEAFKAAEPVPQSKTGSNEETEKETLKCLDSSKSKVKLDEEIPNENQIAEKKSPVIMFKWGSAKKPFRCHLCDMSFTDGSLLCSHLEKHKNSKDESKKPFPCQLCTKSYQTKRALERHHLVHSGQSQKACKYCYKLFANKENLDKHLLMHSGNVWNKAQTCPSCNEQFTSQKLLEKHISTHLQIKNFKCKVCEKAFTRKEVLDRHMYTHDLGKRRRHKCVECSKSFTFLFALKRHVRSVHGGEPDGKNCEICGKFIKNKENINRHMQLHQGVRPFDCPTCGKKFSQKQHMIDHMVIHTNSLPFQCKVCEYSFRYRRTLSRHMKKHFKVDKNKQRYVCMDCHTTYSCEKELIEHALKSHYDFKNCKICKKTFDDEKVYRQHMLTDHNPYALGIKKCVVNKATETDGDLLCKAENEGVKYIQMPEITKKNETPVIYSESETTTENVAIENELVYSDESAENLIKEGGMQDASYSLKNEILGGEEIVYILYEDIKIEGTDENAAFLQNCVQMAQFVQEQHQVDNDTLTENQTVQISEFCDQPTSYELEENTAEIETMEEKGEVEVVQIPQGTDECIEQTLIHVSKDEPCLYPMGENISKKDDSTEKKVMYTYNVAVPKVIKEDGTVDDIMEKSNYTAERFKLLQSLIDYAEKIQEEEEVSISNDKELDGGSETQI